MVRCTLLATLFVVLPWLTAAGIRGAQTAQGPGQAPAALTVADYERALSLQAKFDGQVVDWVMVWRREL